MARKPKPQTTEPSVSDASSVPEDLAYRDRRTVMMAIKAIMGCGDHDAEKKFETLTSEQRAQIVELEANQNRAAVVAIVYA